MRKAAIALGVLSSALAGTSLLLWQRLQLQEKQIAAMQVEANTLRACPKVEVATRGAGGCVNVPGLPVEPRAATLAPPDPDVDDRLQRAPEFQSEMVNYLRLDLRQQHAAFVSALNLSREKEDQLLLILARQAFEGRQGIPPEYTREEWHTKTDSELRAVLSQSQIDAYRRYRETAGTREQVKSLRDELMQTREPLRDEQIEPLVEALYPEEVKLLEETREFTDGLDKSVEALPTSERQAEDYFAEREAAAAERKLAAAATILSRYQLKTLRNRLELQQAMGRQGSKLRRMQSELAGVSDAASSPAN